MKIRVALVTLVALIAPGRTCSQEAPLLVHINTNVAELQNKNSCTIHHWANRLEDGCRCCLVRTIHDTLPPTKDADMVLSVEQAQHIVTECNTSGSCTAPILQTLTKNAPETELPRILKQLYNEHVIIKDVSRQGIVFDQHGSFTPEGLKNFLNRAYLQGKLPHQYFSSPSCLDVRELSEYKGYATTQLFLVTSTCGPTPREFILKEMSHKYKEAKKLADFFGIPELAPYIYPNHPAGYPSIVVPLAFLRYGDHYLSLMERAPGVSLSSLMENYITNPTIQTKQEATRAYKSVGKALAQFHLAFMKDRKPGALAPTVVHGDLHHGNVFYDPASDRVFYIDNERLPATVNKKVMPGDDITHLIALSAQGLVTPKKIKKTIDREAWLSLIMPSFIEGYIEAFPLEERGAVLQALKKEWSAFQSGEGWWHDMSARYQTLWSQEIDKIRASLPS